MRWLRTNGKWIVDEDGNIVLLRGANFMGYEFGAWSAHTEEDYARMASWGLNVVRLPIAWHYIEPEPGFYNESYFTNYVDRDITWAKKYGIYIILDMHQWYWSKHFSYAGGGWTNGLPSWMISAYPNNATGLGQAINDFWLGKAPNGTEASAENPSMKDRFIAMWKYVAQRYANEPTIAGYDLFNEPYYAIPYIEGGLDASQTATYLYPFYNRLIDAIRTVDSHHIIFYEPVGGWHTDSAQLLNKTNIVFSYHYYLLSGNYSGDASMLEKDIINRYLDKPTINPIRNWNIPCFVGEFGVPLKVNNSSLWVRDTVSIWNRYEIGWAWWTYWKSDVADMSLCYANGTEKLQFIQYLKQSL
jgi:endoglycosylceramidase